MSLPHLGHTPDVQDHKYLSPKIILKDLDANRAEWLNLRRGKISSSNVAVVCGLSPYKSPLQLWAEWTGKVEDTFSGNKATQVGNALEPLVASWFAERTGLGVDKADALYGDQELSWLVCSPDYLINGGDPLEIKTGSFRTAHRWGEGRAPYEYVLQLQIQMRVLGRSRGVLTAFLGDFESMPDVSVEYDPELFAMVREKSEAFLDCVRQDIPPAAGAGDAELIRTISQREEGAVVVWNETEADVVVFLVAQARAAAETAAKIRKELDTVDKQRKELENRIKQMMGKCTVGNLPDGRCVRLTTVHVGEKTVGPYSYDRLGLPKN
jgi:putative phage-type endonuclease